jgi:hypothetical protein
MEGVMMCRVTAPPAAWIRREAASRPPLRRVPGASRLTRQLRIVRHRTLRWFTEPIASVERERRDADLAPSLRCYDFRSWRALPAHAGVADAGRGRGRVSSIRPLG